MGRWGEDPQRVDGRMNWPPVTGIDAAPAKRSTPDQRDANRDEDGMGEGKATLSPSMSTSDPTVEFAGRLRVVGPSWARRPLESMMSDLSVALDFSAVPFRETTTVEAPAERVEQIIAATTADGALIVVPRVVSIADAISAPVVDGVPTGIVSADAPADLRPVLRAIRRTSRPEWTVFAMGKNRYLTAAEAVLDRARQGKTDHSPRISVRDRRADRCSRNEASRALAAGPRLAVYVGHGQPNGWSGYQTLRWTHLSSYEQRAPMGAVAHLACETMSPTAHGSPYGARFVETGRAAASLGWLGSIDDESVSEIARVVGRGMESGAVETVGDLIIKIAHCIEHYSAIDTRLLSQLRLVGSPLQRIR